MIISHKLKLIFIKPKKVGGTSFEIALSKYCGDDDVITPISDDDESIRKELGYKGAQNYKISNFNKSAPNFLESWFFNHMSANIIKSIIPKEIWEEYLKISIYRDPCEVLISHYFYDNPGIPFKDYVARTETLEENFNITHIENKCAIDYMIKYDDLRYYIELLEDKIKTPGLYNTFARMDCKKGKRPSNAIVSNMFTKEMINFVQKKARRFQRA